MRQVRNSSNRKDCSHQIPTLDSECVKVTMRDCIDLSHSAWACMPTHPPAGPPARRPACLPAFWAAGSSPDAIEQSWTLKHYIRLALMQESDRFFLLTYLEGVRTKRRSRAHKFISGILAPLPKQVQFPDTAELLLLSPLRTPLASRRSPGCAHAL